MKFKNNFIHNKKWTKWQWITTKCKKWIGIVQIHLQTICCLKSVSNTDDSFILHILSEILLIDWPPVGHWFEDVRQRAGPDPKHQHVANAWGEYESVNWKDNLITPKN